MADYKNTKVTFPTRRKAIRARDIIEFTDYITGTVVVESVRSSRKLGHSSTNFIDCRRTDIWEPVAKPVSFKSIY